VQATRHLVAATAELAASVEDGMHDLQRIGTGLLVPADRHAAAVIAIDGAAVGLDAQLDPRCVAGHRLIDRVVDDLPHQVVQATGVGRADVHGRPSADGLQPFENLDALGRVSG
jgi:hypothetical protein